MHVQASMPGKQDVVRSLLSLGGRRGAGGAQVSPPPPLLSPHPRHPPPTLPWMA